jgi:hypothetical protein
MHRQQPDHADGSFDIVDDAVSATLPEQPSFRVSDLREESINDLLGSDVLNAAQWRRNPCAILTKPLEVKLDCFEYGLLRCLRGCARCDAAGQFGNVRREIGTRRFNDDRVAYESP